MQSLDVLVVGAGLGGLAVALALSKGGHRVTVVDAVPKFAEVGAGLHVPPNASRLLSRWGIDVGDMQSIVKEYRFVRFADGRTISTTQLEDLAEEDSAAYRIVQRVDLHRALLDAVVSLGCRVLMGKPVVEYDFDVPLAKTTDGSVLTADLIIAADGMQSKARPLLTETPDSPYDAGDVAYRFTIPAATLCDDPELSSLVREPCLTFWCGPEAHFVGHSVRNGREYNIMICAASDGKTSGGAGDNRELLERFSGWEPRIRKLCGMAAGIRKWRLYGMPDVSTWVHSSYKVCLLGDACHPMLPYLMQGAAMVFEDAAVLGRCLDVAEEGGLKSVLSHYKETRMPRVRHVQAETREHQHIWHLEDGWKQAFRDKKMKENTAANPVFWGHDQRRRWLFGYDAERVGKDAATDEEKN